MYSLITNDEDSDKIIKEEDDSGSFDFEKEKQHLRQNSDFKTPSNDDILQQITNDLLSSKTKINTNMNRNLKAIKPEDKMKKHKKMKEKRGNQIIFKNQKSSLQT